VAQPQEAAAEGVLRGRDGNLGHHEVAVRRALHGRCVEAPQRVLDDGQVLHAGGREHVHLLEGEVFAVGRMAGVGDLVEDPLQVLQVPLADREGQADARAGGEHALGLPALLLGLLQEGPGEVAWLLVIAAGLSADAGG